MDPSMRPLSKTHEQVSEVASESKLIVRLHIGQNSAAEPLFPLALCIDKLQIKLWP